MVEVRIEVPPEDTDLMRVLRQLLWQRCGAVEIYAEARSRGEFVEPDAEVRMFEMAEEVTRAMGPLTADDARMVNAARATALAAKETQG
ncbi:MAG: hypothetical protein AAFU79_32195 [Myxococcota bacterium]